MELDLSKLRWTLSGWAPFSWRWAFSMENRCDTLPEVAEIPAAVPGSVQMALRNAGLLPDWFAGQNARLCEWVENRDWLFSCELPADITVEPNVRLHCKGLDGTGEVLLNKKAIGHFDNAFIPYDFDLTPQLQKDRPNRLAIVFFTPPRALGQINRTSRIDRHHIKPRFNYGWDWCNRLVQIGIWDKITLRTGLDGALDALTCRPDGAERLAVGGELPEAFCGALRLALREHGKKEIVAQVAIPVEEFRRRGGRLECPGIRPWNPNGCGERTRYELEVSAQDTSGGEASRCFATGFVEIEWRRNPGAPENAAPWLCVVNGRPVFLQGVNWTPVRPNFADVPEAEVRRRLELYAAMGCNVLRVWGGAVLEKEFFYRCCDELGLMVIQEFPLSSSGIDNFPPEAPEDIAAYAGIASSYVARRQSHPCVLAWCGGNELQWGMENPREGVGKPIGLEHPMLARFAEICRTADPQRRFLPSSPSGPRGFGGEEFGQGLHWDVHGPWHLVGGTLEGQRAFWEQDDALLRSEAGVPGATTVELMERYAGGLSPMPFSQDNPFWRRYYWYHHYDLFRTRFGREPGSLQEYVEWSQTLQAEALSIAVGHCKRRFPACGGVLLWMGHDAFPCSENLSLLNFDGTPKPAVAALKKIFRA